MIKDAQTSSNTPPRSEGTEPNIPEVKESPTNTQSIVPQESQGIQFVQLDV